MSCHRYFMSQIFFERMRLLFIWFLGVSIVITQEGFLGGNIQVPGELLPLATL